MASLWGVGLFISIISFTDIHVFYTNSVDSDQTPHSAATLLSVHY